MRITFRSRPVAAFVVMCTALLIQSPPAHAATMMFISNFGNSTNSPLAYNTTSHVLTVVDNKSGISGTFVAPDPSNTANLDLFAVQDNGGTSMIYKYPYNPVSGTTGSGSTFGSSITNDSRGMDYSPLNNKIYLTTSTGTGGEIRQFTASGGGAGTQGTPIVLGVSTRPFDVTVDSVGNLWIVGFTGGATGQIYKYDPSTSTATLKYQAAAVFIRDAIAPANFAGGAYTGDIFFTNITTNTVEYFNPGTSTHGVLANIAPNLLNGAAGIGFDPSDGTLYVTNAIGNTVVFYDSTGTTFHYATNLGTSNTILNGPNDLSFYPLPVPEPTSLALLGMGAAILFRRRGRQ